MNNRFKFRVWDKKHNEYIPSSMISTLLYFGHKDEFHIEFECFSTFADDLIIEQYTGLKDNCGNLIYEGDIVEIANGSINGDVWKDNITVEWIADKGRYNLPLWTSEVPDWSHYVEIIGNVHTGENK